MKIIETNYGLFIKKRGKLYEYVGTACMEIPILTAKQVQKVQDKIQALENANE